MGVFLSRVLFWEKTPRLPPQCGDGDPWVLESLYLLVVYIVFVVSRTAKNLPKFFLSFKLQANKNPNVL